MVGSVFAVLYLALFLYKATTNSAEGLLFGFCVWSSPNLPHPDPTNTNGCDHQPNNSHMYAFYIDCVMTLVVVGLYVFVMGHPELKEKAKSIGVTALNYVGIGFIILAHGLLHFFLYLGLDCYKPENEINGWSQVIGHVFYAAFTFALCLLILFLGFVQTGQLILQTVVSLSAGFAAVLTVLTLGMGTEWILPGLFAITHPLSCFTGLFTKSPLFTRTLGWLFLLATLTGIAELTQCQTFYQAIGGHFWYDIWLHIAVISSLPPFVTLSPKKTHDA